MRMKFLIFFIGFIFTSLAQAKLPIAMVDALQKAEISQENVSVYVQAVDSNSASIAHNANKAMNPASVMKLVTTYAALQALAPAYRWKTDVYREGSLNQGVLNGNLFFKGYGDPSLKAQDFWRLLMALQQAGIKEINGDVIIDKSYFAKELDSRVTFDDEKWRAYNALPSALLVNGRNTSFKFLVQEGRVNVHQEFELPQVKVINQMKLRTGSCGDWRHYFSYSITPNLEGATVTFTGSYSAECEERYLELSVMNDEEYAFATFKKLWAELGGKFNGKLQVRDVPPNAEKVISQVSEPLGTVIREINKWSNNVMARQLMLTLAAEKMGTPATQKNGAQAIKDTLSSQGLDVSSLVIENGSGLSRIERISAAHLGQMLVSAYRQPIMPELMASMPILGVDGTVKKRLNETPVQAKAHLKTGSIEGVSAIAGYLLDANNKRHVIVIMVNHPNASGSKSAQDALISSVFSSNP